MSKWIRALIKRETAANAKDFQALEDDPHKAMNKRRAQLAHEDIEGTDQWQGAINQKYKDGVQE